MLSLGIFCVFHFYIIFKNYTTYEFITKVINKKVDNYPQNIGSNNNNDEPIISKSIYDIGAMANFQQVFGTNLLCWFLPIQPCSIKNPPRNSSSTSESKFNEEKYNSGLSFKVQLMESGGDYIAIQKDQKDY